MNLCDLTSNVSYYHLCYILGVKAAQVHPDFREGVQTIPLDGKNIKEFATFFFFFHHPSLVGIYHRELIQMSKISAKRSFPLNIVHNAEKLKAI